MKKFIPESIKTALGLFLIVIIWLLIQILLKS